VQLVEEASRQRLPGHVASQDGHVFLARGLFGQPDGVLDALGDEHERQLGALGRLVGDHEDRPAERGLAVPARVVVGLAADDRRAHACHEIVEDLAALRLVRLEPIAEAARLAVGARHETVERDRVDAQDDAHA
jgi:hypothetical protein